MPVIKIYPGHYFPYLGKASHTWNQVISASKQGYQAMNAFDDIKRLQERIALYEDMQAYKQLYDLLFSQLHYFSATIVRSNESAEEIVSDVFIKVWQLRNKLMEIENLRVYLYTITKNFSLNYITRNSKQTTINLDETDIGPAVDVQGPAELCISADMIIQIKKIIQQLPPRCRIIFQLVKEDGMKYKEVAEILNISVLTVRNQLALAIKKIGESLPPYLSTSITHRNFFSKS
jgi:RNA polymerase sigma-70 factor (ECF subfamily)